MKNNFYIFVFFLFFSCFSEPVKKEVNYSKFLKLDIIQNFESDLESNVDLIIKFPIRNLVFKKVSNSFSADFTIDVLINGYNDEIILADSWSENIIKKYYEDTKIGDVELVKRVSLPLGEFSLKMIVNDFYNNISWSTKSNFSVRQVKGLNNIQTFYKNNDSLLLYNESYPIEKVDTLWIEYDISDDYDDEIVFEYEFLDIILNDDFVYKDDNLDKINIITFDDEKSLNKHMQFKEVVFRKKILLKDSISRFHIPIIEDYFNFLRIELKYKNQVIVKSFNFIDKRDYEYDYSILFGPMFYLLNSRYYEFEEMSYEDKKNFIINYWDGVSKKNNDSGKLLKEFYKRTLYVNQNYAFLSKEGWETDRGRIYLINGKPNKIESEFSDSGEYEIWIYSSNKRYVFKNIFGRYELVNSY
tara:strand:+ start:392 stop:1633 length:1242 start_codon:yes stop_codon:yes gene_type:complete